MNTARLITIIFVLGSLLSVVACAQTDHKSKIKAQSESQRAGLFVKKAKRREHNFPRKHPVLKPIDNLELDLPKSVRDNIRFVFPGSSNIVLDGKPWRPRRHFGPFTHGQQFSDIQVWVERRNLITWHENNYFSNHPDSAIYAKYYTGGTLPSSQTPSIPRRTQFPGTQPLSTSTTQPISYNDILLELNGIRYSSLYGGSVRLVFRASEDTEFEVRSGNKLWDINRPIMSVYVNPRPRSLNPLTAGAVGVANFVRYVYVHITANGITQYEILNPGAIQQNIIISQTIDENAVNSALSTVSADARNRIANSAFRFVHGFLHSQFQNMIGSNEAVDEIEISDNFVDMTTHVREPIFAIQTRVDWMLSWTDFISDDEYSVRIDSTHLFSNGNTVPGPSTILKLNEEDPPTHWRSYGIWQVSGCSQITAVLFDILVTELDLAGSDDRFDPINEAWSWDCSQINQEVAAGPQATKTIDEFTNYSDLILNDEDLGGIVMGFRMLLWWR